MTTLVAPTNGHARIHDADFEPKRKTKQPAKPTRFETLLDEIEAQAAAPSELPSFPVESLPPALRDWVEAEARRTQAASDVAAMSAIALSSAALARKVWIEARPGFREPLNLYVGLKLEAGERGADTLERAARPLRELEFEELDQAEVDAATVEIYRPTWEADLRKIDARGLAVGDAGKLEQVAKMHVELARDLAKSPPRRFAEEISARSLHRELGLHGRIACISSSGEVFRQLAMRNSAAKDRLSDLLERGHAARDFVAELPKGRLAAVRHATVTCASIFDESTAAAIAAQRNGRGRGLLSSFLFAAPRTDFGKREIAPPGVANDIAAAYRDGLRGIAARQAGCLILAPEAEQLFREWETEIESQLGHRGRLAPIRSWATKLAAATLRIAGILHAWTNSAGIVSRDTLAAAIAIGRYLVPHAAHLLEKLGLADDDCDLAERTVLRYARATREFSARDAQQHLRRTLFHPSMLDRALVGLVHRGYLRPIDVTAGRGRPSSMQFALASRGACVTVASAQSDDMHDVMHVADTATECSQNSVAESRADSNGHAPQGKSRRRRPRRAR